MKDIFKEFVGKKVRATQKSGKERVGTVHPCPGDSYPYVISYEEEDQMSYKSDGRYWKGGSSLDIVKLELVEELKPEGEWGQVICRSGGVGIEWKNPVEGKEEELLRVLRDCYGCYPNAENQIVERIKGIWE